MIHRSEISYLRRNDSDVVVVVPTLNEEEGIGPTLKDLKDALDDPFVLVVDGNSVDRTVKIATDLGAEVITQKDKGKGLAIAVALEHINSETRYVVFTDADYTYPAEYIPQMIEVLEKNPHFGMVIGNRFDKEFEFFKAISSFLYLGNRLLAFAQHLLNGVRLCDPLSGLRVIRWEILRNWRPRSRSFDVEVELNYHVEKRGFSIKEIPIKYRQRLGEKKLKPKHGLTILKRILIESFTPTELKFQKNIPK